MVANEINFLCWKHTSLLWSISFKICSNSLIGVLKSDLLNCRLFLNAWHACLNVNYNKVYQKLSSRLIGCGVSDFGSQLQQSRFFQKVFRSWSLRFLRKVTSDLSVCPLTVWYFHLSRDNQHGAEILAWQLFSVLQVDVIFNAIFMSICMLVELWTAVITRCIHFREICFASGKARKFLLWAFVFPWVF